MNNALAIGIVLILLIPGSWWVSHNRLVVSRNDVAAGWADIDAELQRRHALVPQLASTVQGAAAHETELLVELARRNDVVSRSASTPSTANQLEPPLTDAIRQVVALRERYPQLNSQQNFLDLQRQLSLTEDRIAAARRYYNTRVERLNRRIEAFPSSVVARHHGFAKAEFFDA